MDHLIEWIDWQSARPTRFGVAEQTASLAGWLSDREGKILKRDLDLLNGKTTWVAIQ